MYGMQRRKRTESVDAEGEEHRAQNRINGVALSHEAMGEVENRQIVDEELRADGPADEVVQEDGDASKAARQQIRRQYEEVDADAADGTAEKDYKVAAHLMNDFLFLHRHALPSPHDFPSPSQRPRSPCVRFLWACRVRRGREAAA